VILKATSLFDGHLMDIYMTCKIIRPTNHSDSGVGGGKGGGGHLTILVNVIRGVI
jgi:hypothetical protein